MDVTEATFETEVIARSHETPVVVDFWAAWCGPCRQLAPVLERAVAEREGEVVLAKVDIDANPGLAQRFRVQSIPLVKGFRAGAEVAQFVGMQGPAQIADFLNRLVPSRTERLIAAGDEASLRQAMEDEPANIAARTALARLLFADGRSAEVAAVLEPVSFDPTAEGLLARLRLEAVDQPDVAAGMAALGRGRTEQALGHLVDAVTVADPALRDDLRVCLLAIFAELGEQHPLATRFRRRLSRALY